MPELPPTAQAVKRDLTQIMKELSQRCRVSISATDALPITLETNDASLQAGINALCAAALRAAADQVVPLTKITPQQNLESRRDAMVWGMANQTQIIRQQLLAIADELKSR